MAAQGYNTSPGKVKAEASGVQGHPPLHVRFCLKKQKQTRTTYVEKKKKSKYNHVLHPTITRYQVCSVVVTPISEAGTWRSPPTRAHQGKLKITTVTDASGLGTDTFGSLGYL